MLGSTGGNTVGSQADRKTPRAILERDLREAIFRIRELERQQVDRSDLDEFALDEAGLQAKTKGYFRMGYQEKAGTYWASWKWTEGALDEHYTYASGATLGECLAVVCAHAQECEAGKRKATKDTPYKRKVP